MDFKIEVGDMSVLQSGTVIGVVNQSIEFLIDDLTIEFIFVDNEDREQVVNPESVSNKHLKLTFINFNNSLGTGNIEPLKIGSYGDNHLLLSYRIYSLGENVGKTLHYTFLTASKTTDNGSR